MQGMTLFKMSLHPAILINPVSDWTVMHKGLDVAQLAVNFTGLFKTLITVIVVILH